MQIGSGHIGSGHIGSGYIGSGHIGSGQTGLEARAGIIFGSSGNHFGIIWQSFWDHLAIILASSGNHVGIQWWSVGREGEVEGGIGSGNGG